MQSSMLRLLKLILIGLTCMQAVHGEGTLAPMEPEKEGDEVVSSSSKKSEEETAPETTTGVPESTTSASPTEEVEVFFNILLPVAQFCSCVCWLDISAFRLKKMCSMALLQLRNRNSQSCLLQLELVVW